MTHQISRSSDHRMRRVKFVPNIASTGCKNVGARFTHPVITTALGHDRKRKNQPINQIHCYSPRNCKMTATSMGSIIPKGKTQFLDGAGVPLASGTVAFYIPGTDTPLATYQDQALSIANINPVDLDGNGEAIIWGYGLYRQIVQDSNGNTIWDEVVGAPPLPVFGVDSGNANAMVVDIPGVTSLFTGLTLVVIPANSNTGGTTVQINSIAAAAITQGSTPLAAGSLAAGVAAQMIFDGTNFQLLNSNAVAESAPQPGDIKAIAGPTPPTGWDLCYGKTYNRTTNAALFSAIGTAWGAGDGATTFLGPDLRGRTLAGVDAMGGTAANRLTSASLGVTAALGVTGGSEDVQSHNHSVTDPGHDHPIPGDIANGNGSAAFALSQTGSNFVSFAASSTTSTAETNITLADYGTGASQNVQPTAVINWIMYVG